MTAQRPAAYVLAGGAGRLLGPADVRGLDAAGAASSVEGLRRITASSVAGNAHLAAGATALGRGIEAIGFAAALLPLRAALFAAGSALPVPDTLKAALAAHFYFAAIAERLQEEAIAYPRTTLLQRLTAGLATVWNLRSTVLAAPALIDAGLAAALQPGPAPRLVVGAAASGLTEGFLLLFPLLFLLVGECVVRVAERRVGEQASEKAAGRGHETATGAATDDGTDEIVKLFVIHGVLLRV